MFGTGTYFGAPRWGNFKVLFSYGSDLRTPFLNVGSGSGKFVALTIVTISRTLPPTSRRSRAAERTGSTWGSRRASHTPPPPPSPWNCRVSPDHGELWYLIFGMQWGIPMLIYGLSIRWLAFAWISIYSTIFMVIITHGHYSALHRIATGWSGHQW
jgi:hypothetical protein